MRALDLRRRCSLCRRRINPRSLSLRDQKPTVAVPPPIDATSESQQISRRAVFAAATARIDPAVPRNRQTINPTRALRLLFATVSSANATGRVATARDLRFLLLLIFFSSARLVQSRSLVRCYLTRRRSAGRALRNTRDRSLSRLARKYQARISREEQCENPAKSAPASTARPRGRVSSVSRPRASFVAANTPAKSWNRKTRPKSSARACPRRFYELPRVITQPAKRS